jgi:hypothetical protein
MYGPVAFVLLIWYGARVIRILSDDYSFTPLELARHELKQGLKDVKAGRGWGYARSREELEAFIRKLSGAPVQK